jgi:hypothetical protein
MLIARVFVTDAPFVALPQSCTLAAATALAVAVEERGVSSRRYYGTLRDA